MFLPDLLHRLVLAAKFAHGVGDGIANEDQIVIAVLNFRDLLSMPTARRRFGEIGVAELGGRDSPPRTENYQHGERAKGRVHHHDGRLDILYAHRNSSTAFPDDC